MHSIRGWVLAAFSVWCLHGSVWPGRAAAQPAAGTIAGRVILTATGDPVHGASIVVLGARRSAVTAADGTFEIADVPEGTYEVIARREHLAAVRQVVAVLAGQTAVLDLAMGLESLHEDVVVTGAAGGLSTAFDAFNAVASLDSIEIARNLGPTVADVLDHQPGVSKRSFGAGSSRPIIRGFDGDRVLIMQDGVRTGDLSSQSGDHGVSIDPAGLERLEVVKGPATLLFGSNAIGGVVNAVTPQDAFRASPFTGTIGAATFDAGTANAQGGANGSVQWGNGRWTAWAGGGARRTGDYDTPLGVVENSRTRLATGRFGVGWLGARTFVSAGAQLEDGRFGIPFAGEFHGHDGGDDAEEDEDAHDEAPSIAIASTRRDIRLDAGFRNLRGRVLDSAKVTIGHTAYGHEEIETLGGADSIGTVFDNDTTTIRLQLEQTPRARVAGRVGVEFFSRDFSAVGEEALAPPATQRSFAAFAYEEMPAGRLRLQFGARIERNQYAVGARPGGSGEEAGDPHDGHDHEAPEPRDRAFTGASGSLGVRTSLGDHAAIVANLTAATRAPALEELYNFGPHVGNLTFEIGNPDLDLERTLGVDVSLRSRDAKASGELNLFHYAIANYVFLDLGDEMVDGLREAQFLQGDSRFSGLEASGHLDLHEHLHLNAAASVVRARLVDGGEDLPRIPPFSGRLRVEVPWGALTVAPEIVFNARQSRVFRDERPTAGSTVLNLDAAYLVVREHATHTIALKAYNLANETYRLHTSFIKELAPEIGRGVRLTYTIRFF